jgi:hypothetical protein
MTSGGHLYGIVVTAGERQQLFRLLERHGSARQQQHLGHLVSKAADLGSIAELAATVDTPGRVAGVHIAPNQDGRAADASGAPVALER